MSERVTLVVDPRFPPTSEGRGLARRHASLAAETVILLDNGKLLETYGPYEAIFDVLEEELGRAHAGVRIERVRDDLLVGTTERLATVADELATRRPAGVVIALCDWGVSQPSTIVASLLEERGVPTTLIATDVGILQAYATASRMIPGLPLVRMSSLRDADRNDVASEVRGLAGAVLEGLTANAEPLHRRFAEHDMPAAPVAGPSGTLEITGDDPSASFTELMAAERLGDGLPLVAPTPERVAAFLEAAGREQDDPVWPVIPPRSGAVTAGDVAAVAVLAGCEPRWAPIVFAAYEAMGEAEFKVFQGAITVHPAGTLVLVSGPLAAELGIAAGRGCLGPGFPANARIGRAVALAAPFLLGAQPGATDLTGQGSPAEFTYCCAENIAESPWSGLNADFADPGATTVTVVKAEGPHNMVDQQSVEPERLLETFARSMATLGANCSYVPGAQVVVFLNPEHAALLAGAGWSKADVARFLFERARNPRDDLRGRGVAPIWPPEFEQLDPVPITTRPEDFLIAVVGGAGTASQVAIPWGFSRGITRAVRS